MEPEQALDSWAAETKDRPRGDADGEEAEGGGGEAPATPSASPADTGLLMVSCRRCYPRHYLVVRPICYNDRHCVFNKKLTHVYHYYMLLLSIQDKQSIVSSFTSMVPTVIVNMMYDLCISFIDRVANLEGFLLCLCNDIS